MSISTAHEDNSIYIRPEGSVAGHESSILAKNIITNLNKNIILDMQDVEHLSLKTLQVLFIANNILKRNNRKLSIINEPIDLRGTLTSMIFDEFKKHCLSDIKAGRPEVVRAYAAAV